MPNTNLAVIAGHLARDPEIRYTSNGVAICEFTLGTTETSKDGKEYPQFVPCKAWRTDAECVGSLTKGAGLTITGRVCTESWDDKESGKKRYKTFVQATSVAVFTKQSETRKTQTEKPVEATTETKPKQDKSNDDVPF